MIICIDVSERTKDSLDRLLDMGQYRDYSEAVSVAVANQVLLHNTQRSENATAIIPNRAATTPKENETHAVPKAEKKSPSPTSEEGKLPELFAALNSHFEPTKFSPFPNDAYVPGQVVPVDRWIFGQHNKLLPAKATCRALARLQAEQEVLPLPKMASEIASHAAKLGDYLRQLDEASGVHRDDTLSFAFPYSTSENGDKSRLRFANQFVASFTKQGMLSGLPAELKLVNRDHSRNPRVLLTEAGWRFAMISNPILDKGADGRQPKFSEEEVDFLVEHIRTRVPAEDFAFRSVLDTVASGANTPEQLDEGLEKFLTKRTDKPFTPAFLTTQRAGVVSRMIDLGLVQRVREGINVTYVITKKGSEYSPKSVAEGK